MFVLHEISVFLKSKHYELKKPEISYDEEDRNNLLF